MSSYFFKAFSVVAAGVFAAFVTLEAEEWMRGSAVVTSVTGDVTLQEVGGESLQLQSAGHSALPVSGLLQVSVKSEGAVFIKTSNRISIYNEGAGFFAIERFEQDVATSIDQGKSRMIFNFRQGFLAVDNRVLSDDSQMIVETPIGRISVKDGWWQMRIAADERSNVYDFSIECADGVLRFTDKGGRTYTLRNGQRLRGAGASSRPSIEVAEISEEGSELFEQFVMMEASAAALNLSSDTFLSKMKPLKHVRSEVVATSSETKVRDVRRPLVIGYTPQSAPVTPFRAIIRPPSSYQADLF